MTQFAEKLSVKEKVGYGLGDSAANFIFQTMMIFLLYFYTDIFGIPAAVVGTLFLVSRIWDAINDPIMGAIADRTKSKYGRFRPWVLWTAIPFGAMAVVMFTTPDLSTNGKIAYAYVTYILMMMIYTANNIPYGALSGVMTANSLERTSLSSYRFVFAFAAGLVIQGTTLPLVGYLGKGDRAIGYQLTMALFAFVAVIFFFFTFYLTKERIEPPKDQKSTFKTDLKDLFDNKPWLVLFFLGIITFIYISIRASFGIFYFKYYVKNEALFSAWMVAGTLALMAGITFSKLMTEKFGKRNTYLICNALSTVFVFLFFLPEPDQIVLIFAINVLGQFVVGPTVPILWAMYADTADYSEWKHGRRATGIVFSAATFGQKFGWGIGGALGGWLLSLFGYVANADQTDGAILGIKLMLTVFPGVLMVFSLIMLWSYSLDETLMQRIQLELAQRRDEEKEIS